MRVSEGVCGCCVCVQSMRVSEGVACACSLCGLCIVRLGSTKRRPLHPKSVGSENVPIQPTSRVNRGREQARRRHPTSGVIKGMWEQGQKGANGRYQFAGKWQVPVCEKNQSSMAGSGWKQQSRERGPPKTPHHFELFHAVQTAKTTFDSQNHALSKNGGFSLVKIGRRKNRKIGDSGLHGKF